MRKSIGCYSRTAHLRLYLWRRWTERFEELWWIATSVRCAPRRGSVRAADTNILVRLIVQDEPSQVKAAERFVAGGVWVATLVLAEMAWVLARCYSMTASAQAAAIDLITNHEKVVVEDPALITAAVERLRTAPMLSFSDCLILEGARRLGHLPLGTFDRRLAKQPGAVAP